MSDAGRSLRQVHLDFHTPGCVAPIAEAFDAAAFAEPMRVYLAPDGVDVTFARDGDHTWLELTTLVTRTVLVVDSRWLHPVRRRRRREPSPTVIHTWPCRGSSRHIGRRHGSRMGAAGEWNGLEGERRP